MAMTARTETWQWACEEFDGTDLGDARLTKRLVEVAARLAAAPAGRATQVYETTAELLGTYRFLNNERIEPARLTEAPREACIARSGAEPFVFVPVDGSSLSFRDRDELRTGLGPVGSRSKKGRGLEVMSAIAVSSDGVPLGLLDQVYWARSKRKRKKAERKLKNKETRHWVDVVERVAAAFESAGSKCKPWFQLDRGADFRELLELAQRAPYWVTARVAQNRCVIAPEKGLLRDVVSRQPVRGHMTVNVPARPGRQARQARLALRTCTVTVNSRTASNKVPWNATLPLVQVREVGTTPPGEEPIEWTLWTNHPIETFADACLVVQGYAQRWRIEEFHRCWKSTCHIEDSQLHSGAAITRWAIISATVAMRIERLKRLARTEPDLPASSEFTRHEIDALILLRKPANASVGDDPPLGTTVRWIADLGGYTGPKSSGGPPGATVIGRGLVKLETAAAMLAALAPATRPRRKPK